MQQSASTKSTRRQAREKSKRRRRDKPLCMNTDKLLAILPYLTKRELDKCQEVCQLWDNVIERHWNPKLFVLQRLNEQVLTQRRRLFALSIGPSNTHHCWRRPLDLDSWRGEDEERAKFIDNCTGFLTGKLLFPHEEAEWNIDVAVMVDFERDDGEWRGALVRNRLDPQGARFIARLLDRLEDVFLEELDLNFNRTPELDAGAEDLRDRFYISPFLLVLTGKRLRLTARYLTPSTPIMGGSPAPATSARSMARTLDLVTKCEFLSGRNLSLGDFLEVAAVGRGHIRLAARKLNLSTIRDFDQCVQFFEEGLQSLSGVVPCVEVRFMSGLIQPRDELLLTAYTAVSRRKERRRLHVYKFSRTNVHSGEAFYIELYSYRADKKTGVLQVWTAKFLFPPDAD